MQEAENYMSRCLQLARLGEGRVAPNPMVGAVLVHNGKIIGEGYHQQFGGPHAEVNCIADAESKLQHLSETERSNIISQCAMYVSLEPCAHHGKTPPCADLLIEKKIPKVIIATRDEFEKVNGRGIEKLKSAGVEVETGLLDKESLTLNKRFISFDKNKRPYIILKWAESADGFISKKGERRFAISNAYTNRLVHKWRSEQSAIMVGTTTALDDDPELTTRLWEGENPVRIVVDKYCRLNPALRIFNKQSKTIVFNLVKEVQKDNISYVRIKESDSFLQQVLGKLYEMQIQSVLVEGGAKLLQSFISAGFWDEARLIKSKSLIISSGTAAPHLHDATLVDSFDLSTDQISFYVK